MATRVLIVDDSLTVRMDLDRAFRDSGLSPTLCDSGAQAQAALAKSAWDLVVLDVRLPDADGVELLAQIRADPAHEDTIVLLLSTEAEVADRLRGLQTGADDYVGKPYDAASVVARAHQLLRSRSATGADRPTVLVIDDSLTYREHLRASLEGEGYAVVTAAGGEEGLRLAAGRRPNAIVVDGMMPDIDGPTVIRQIRLDAALRDIPCLLLTGSDDDASELRTLEAGADAFVRKHEDLSVLLARLATAARSRTEALPITAAGSVHGPTTLLMVDSDEEYLREAGAALRAEGHEIVLARRAADALTLLAAQPVDCVLLGLNTLHGDLADLAVEIRQLPGLSTVPIVVLGPGAEPTALIDSLAAGADHYIARSDGLPILKANVRSQIRRKQTQDRARRIREELLRGEAEAAEARAAKKLAAARAELVEELQWRNEELDAFAGSVAHDLRTPMTVIKALAEEMIEDDIGVLGKRGQQRIHRIETAVDRMTELVDSLLLLSQASRAELRYDRADISALARDVVDELRRRDPDREVTVTIADGMSVRGDRGLLRVMLANIVGNSWKFTGRVEHARIDIYCERADDVVTYFVRDNGAGFPPANAERIFRPFQRVHTVAQFPGTGIGLTTVRRIIERHGGTVRAQSDGIGLGSTFVITLPVRTDPDDLTDA
ncbi:response regulator [Pilimelia columellifera]|uniref:histidine kinase n=1 Tax=Pilimelia columellifera subsp. columellifera TaxID=706583 RepID=A0ABN3NMQ0_9ACTN